MRVGQGLVRRRSPSSVAGWQVRQSGVTQWSRCTLDGMIAWGAHALYLLQSKSRMTQMCSILTSVQCFQLVASGHSPFLPGSFCNDCYHHHRGVHPKKPLINLLSKSHSLFRNVLMARRHYSLTRIPSPARPQSFRAIPRVSNSLTRS